MKKLAILHGAMRLGWLLIKSLFIRSTLIYRCPECNLVVRKATSTCVRCDTVLDWKGIS